MIIGGTGGGACPTCGQYANACRCAKAAEELAERLMRPEPYTHKLDQVLAEDWEHDFSGCVDLRRAGEYAGTIGEFNSGPSQDGPLAIRMGRGELRAAVAVLGKRALKVLLEHFGPESKCPREERLVPDDPAYCPDHAQELAAIFEAAKELG